LVSFLIADPWSLIYGLSFFGNETFALFLTALFFWCVREISTAETRQPKIWMLCGAVAALGYLVKLTYIFLLVGMAAIICAKAIRLQLPVVSTISYGTKRLAAIFGTFLVISMSVLFLLGGWAEIVNLLIVHAGFIFHTRLPNGGTGFSASVQTMLSTIESSSAVSPIFLIVALSLLCLGYVAINDDGHIKLNSDEKLWCIAAITALLFTTVAVLNHYQPYYVPAIAANLPFAWKPLLRRQAFAKIATFCFAAAAIFTARVAIEQFNEISARASGMEADEKNIMAMPMRKDDSRLWTYRVPDQYFAREFVLQLAGLQDYVHRREKASREYSSYANVYRPYRYIVFDRGYHPNSMVLKQQAATGSLTEPNGMKVILERNAIYHDLKSTIIVENPDEKP
jgi:hypothetical protein